MSCRRNAAQIPARIPLCIFCKPGLAQTVSQAYPGCVHEGSLINILGATLNNINFPWFRHNPSLQPNPSMASVPWGGKGKVISFGTQKHAKALIGFFFSPLLSFYLLQILPKFYFSPQILYTEAKQEKRLPARRTHHAESGCLSPVNWRHLGERSYIQLESELPSPGSLLFPTDPQASHIHCVLHFLFSLFITSGPNKNHEESN